MQLFIVLVVAHFFAQHPHAFLNEAQESIRVDVNLELGVVSSQVRKHKHVLDWVVANVAKDGVVNVRFRPARKHLRHVSILFLILGLGLGKEQVNVVTFLTLVEDDQGQDVVGVDLASIHMLPLLLSLLLRLISTR